MNGFGILFTLAAVALMLVVPKTWRTLPLLLAASYVPAGQEIEIGPLHFSITRLVILAGFARVMMKRERLAGGFNRLDRIMFLWAALVFLSSFFHKNPSAALVLRLGHIYDCLGLYLLFRTFLEEAEDYRRVARFLAILLVPVAMGMLYEQMTGKNCFAPLFGGSAEAVYRHGHYRARGPFVHAILAGTVGAVCMPMALFLWKRERNLALVGLGAAGGIVFASGSSGPIMTTLTIFAALAVWKIRSHMRSIRWAALLIILALDIVMSDPVYYLIARIDITGGSTGWHRAALIQAAITHVDEWWFIGTDVTRHWMPTGIYSNEDHTDITNHFIAMGVEGGMGLMLVFIWLMCAGFAAVGRALRLTEDAPPETRFMIWILGAILFGHVTTFLSVSYFDQILVFFYLQLAMIGSLQVLEDVSLPADEEAPDPATALEPDQCQSC